MNKREILELGIEKFDSMAVFFEWGSRILKSIPGYDDFLVMKLKPTIFSIKESWSITLAWIDMRRVVLNDYFSQLLHKHNIETSTLLTKWEYVLVGKEKVPLIEVVVKWAMIWSPKHIYKNISHIPMRNGKCLEIWVEHNPYVRFDYRNILPDEDICMPEVLADYYIHVENAKKLALSSFAVLKNDLQKHNLDLLDICFFMNEQWTSIVSEISTDNTNIVYTWDDEEKIGVFSNSEKSSALYKSDIINALLWI